MSMHSVHMYDFMYWSHWNTWIKYICISRYTLCSWLACQHIDNWLVISPWYTNACAALLQWHWVYLAQSSCWPHVIARQVCDLKHPAGCINSLTGWEHCLWVKTGTWQCLSGLEDHTRFATISALQWWIFQFISMKYDFEFVWNPDLFWLQVSFCDTSIQY